MLVVVAGPAGRVERRRHCSIRHRQYSQRPLQPVPCSLRRRSCRSAAYVLASHVQAASTPHAISFFWSRCLQAADALRCPSVRESGLPAMLYAVCMYSCAAPAPCVRYPVFRGVGIAPPAHRIHGSRRIRSPPRFPPTVGKWKGGRARSTAGEGHMVKAESGSGWAAMPCIRFREWSRGLAEGGVGGVSCGMRDGGRDGLMTT